MPVAKASSAANTRFSRFIDKLWSYQMKDSPEYATAVGYAGLNHRWSDRSLKASERRKKEVAAFQEELKAFDRKKLSEAEQLYWDLFARSLKDISRSLQFREDLLPVSQMWGVQNEIPQTLALNPRNTAKDYDATLARLAAVPELLTQVEILLRTGIKEGITYPRVAMEKVVPQLEGLLEADPRKNPLLEAFQNIPTSVPAKEHAGIQKKAAAIFKDSVLPAFKTFKMVFVKEYLPHCRANVAWSAQPKGAEWYAFKVEQSTTTTLSPDEIHQIGLKEVARIRKAMEDAKTRAGFKGSLAEFSDFLKKDPRFYFSTAEELIQAYRDLAKRIDPELPRLFGKLPRLPYGVQPIPDYAAPAQPTAYYQPGSPAAGRAGNFFANSYDLASRPKWEMEALTAHEAVPGHHLQIALAQEMEGVPEFRKYENYNAFAEGWALYSEGLGTDLGLYKDPYSDFGRLTYEMWRSIRLVVDTGIHTMGWTREKAIAYFRENASKPDHDIIQEVERYLVMPGQALGYKIGHLKILAIRQAAEERLGDKFDIRRFHDAILGNGALPLDILEKRMAKWR